MSSYIEDFRQGNTKVIKIDYGQGVDTTGWTFYLTLKEKIDDYTPVAQVSTTAGDNVLDDPTNGLVYLTLDSVTSSSIPVGSYYWSVQVDKGGSPAIINTILPPIDDYKDKVSVVQAIKL
jgi:hypothetical protein